MKVTIYFKTTLVVIATALALGLISCKDDHDDNDVTGKESLSVPEKVTIDEEGYISTYNISYDNNIRIKEILRAENGMTLLSTINYDTQGRVSEILYKWSESTILYMYSYSGNRVTVSIDQDGHKGTAFYTFDTDGLTTNYASNSFFGNIAYSYDANKNLTNRLYTIDNKTESSTDITYNNSVSGMCKHVNISKLLILTLNEIDVAYHFLLAWDKSLATIKDSYGNEATYDYSTNNDGYPVKYEVKNGDTSYTVTIAYKQVIK